MVNNDRTDIKVDKEKEIRSEEISKMISEGGLGSDRYYRIDKSHSNYKE